MRKIAFLMLSLLPAIAFCQQYSRLPDLVPFLSGDKFGYCNPGKQIVIEPQFRSAGLFVEDCRMQQSPDTAISKFGTADFATVELKKKWYRINKSGEIMCERPALQGFCVTSGPDWFKNKPNWLFHQDGKLGLKGLHINNRSIKIPAQAVKSNEDVVVVGYGNDTVQVLSPLYDEIMPFGIYMKNGPFIVKMGERYALVGDEDKLLTQFYDSMQFTALKYTLLLVKKDNLHFYVDFYGNEFRLKE